MPTFNALTQSWIPIERTDGNMEHAGILYTLKNSHKIRRICAATPIVSYSIQRILIAFLTDALRPERTRDIATIFAHERFNEKALDEYVVLCNKDGERFELFDDKYPFLQSPIDDQVTNEDKTVAAHLFLELPAGNNHPHFQHDREDSYFFSPSECLQALCTLPAYATYLGRSCYFSVNGMPPMYCLYQGNNLFETLAGSMIPHSKHPEIPLDEPPVIWRSNTRIPIEGKIARISLLHGLTCAPRRVTLIPEVTESGTQIKELYLARGWNYNEITNWRDPHVVYYENNGKITTLKAREGRSAWRDMGRIIHSHSKLKILEDIAEKRNENNRGSLVSLNTYSLMGSFKGAIYAAESWSEDSFSIDISLMEDIDKLNLLQDILGFIENIGSILRSTISKSIKKLEGKKTSQYDKGRFDGLSRQTLTLYFSFAREYVFGGLFTALTEAKSDEYNWERLIKVQTGDAVKKSALLAFHTIADGLGQAANILQWQSLAEKSLWMIINKERKKGGWTDEQS
jgi:CRISPR type I-E-associated protein CasA/Cse1